jgi:hypothetical protein
MVIARERRRIIVQMDDDREILPEQDSAEARFCGKLRSSLDRASAEARRFAYAVGVPVLRSCARAVTSCTGANGLVIRILFGTPLEVHSSALSPVM